MSEKIRFTGSEEGEGTEFFVLEEVRINNTNYILVTESESDDEAEAYILKDVSDETDADALYEIVDDDNELSAVSKVFAELLDDVDIV